MTAGLSERLRRVVDVLPLEPGLRVLEIGGAPGAAAREVARRVAPTGHVLVLDRSRAGIDRTRRHCAAEIEAGLLSTHCAAVEDFALPEGTGLFDLAFACRVGALDGRHRELYASAVEHIRRALKPSSCLYVDTGDPMTQLRLA
ncbi:class I SAM-dependent methyltransferase [Streptomyces sp. NPDC048612]|uniref:class I SAM-dependent methyltransferase n=1 Tax=Streptomyces sp. NPDC048612 TaxID=3365579 RepID=UPI003713641F